MVVIHDVLDALHLGTHLLELLHAADERLDGRGELGSEPLERQQHTDCEIAGYDEPHAAHEHSDVGGGRHELGDKTQGLVNLGVAYALGVGIGLVARPSAEKPGLHARGLKRFDHRDTRHGGGGEVRLVAHLHTGDIDATAGNEIGDADVQQDRHDADRRKQGRIGHHNHQIHHEHDAVDGKRPQSPHERLRNGGICGGARGDIGCHALREKLHGESQHMPDKARIGRHGHLAFKAQQVHGVERRDDDLDGTYRAEQHHERNGPLGTLTREQPVGEHLRECRVHHGEQRGDGTGEHNEGDGSRGAAQALEREGGDLRGLAGRLELLRGSHGQNDTRELPVKLLHGQLDLATAGIVDICLIVREPAHDHEMVETQ